MTFSPSNVSPIHPEMPFCTRACLEQSSGSSSRSSGRIACFAANRTVASSTPQMSVTGNLRKSYFDRSAGSTKTPKSTSPRSRRSATSSAFAEKVVGNGDTSCSPARRGIRRMASVSPDRDVADVALSAAPNSGFVFSWQSDLLRPLAEKHALLRQRNPSFPAQEQRLSQLKVHHLPEASAG